MLSCRAFVEILAWTLKGGGNPYHWIKLVIVKNVKEHYKGDKAAMYDKEEVEGVLKAVNEAWQTTRQNMCEEGKRDTGELISVSSTLDAWEKAVKKGKRK